MRDIDEGSKPGVKEVRNIKTKMKEGNNDEERKQESRKERTKIQKMGLIKGRKDGNKEDED
jgi:hypothetical protein